MSSGVSVGIDLGTTFSAAAYVTPSTGRPEIIPNSDGKKITPSIILFQDGRPIFGTEAEEAFKAGNFENCAAAFKRYMGKNETYKIIQGRAYTAEELSAMLLRHIKEDTEAALGTEIKDAVITVPAYFYSAEREATIKAAEKAGLKVRKIIDEPNAAAMAYGLNHWQENANILVYDLGGGTFDITLIRMNGDGELLTAVTRGDHFLGGRDWDNRLVDIILKKLEDETGLDELNKDEVLKMAEDVKKKLSSMSKANVRVFIPDAGDISVTVTADEFKENTADLLSRTGALCEAVLKEAGIDVKNINDILLTGGSTRMPMVSEYLEKWSGIKPVAHVNPDEAVALGAAIQATKENDKYNKLAVVIANGKKVTDRKTAGLMLNNHAAVKPERKINNLQMLSIRETTAHAMGIIAVSKDGTRYINDIIIPANHPRPVRAARAFSFWTGARSKNEMEIYVLQGDREAPLDNQIPYKYIVTGIEHRPETRGKTVIMVRYTYDNNGVIHVDARQEKSSKNLNIIRDVVPDDMTKYSRPVEHEQIEIMPEPINIVMAVDVSGSMSGEPLDDAKKAMCKFIREMDFAYTSVGVIAVSDETEIICDVINDAKKCINAVKSIECGQTGYGNGAHPFREIKNMLEHRDGRRAAIVLADGVWYRQDKAVSAAKECNKAGIETAAIGFGSADEEFLRDISSQDANAIFVPSSSGLERAFGTIAQSLGGGSKIMTGSDNETWDIDDWND